MTTRKGENAHQKKRPSLNKANRAQFCKHNHVRRSEARLERDCIDRYDQDKFTENLESHHSLRTSLEKTHTSLIIIWFYTSASIRKQLTIGPARHYDVPSQRHVHAIQTSWQKTTRKFTESTSFVQAATITRHTSTQPGYTAIIPKVHQRVPTFDTRRPQLTLKLATITVGGCTVCSQSPQHAVWWSSHVRQNPNPTLKARLSTERKPHSRMKIRNSSCLFRRSIL